MTILKVLYWAATAMCLLMLTWTLLIPGSLFRGKIGLYDDIPNILFLHGDGSIVPSDIVTKYKDHPIVHYVHVFPATVWCGIVPFQLHRPFRKRYPTIHRRLGYIFFLSSISIAGGIIIILQRGLNFTNSQYFTHLPPLPVPDEVVITLIGTYFVWTGLYAFKLAALDKRYSLHEKWILRHVAAGLSVAAQRFLLMTVWFPLTLPPPVSRTVQRSSFVQTEIVGFILSVLIAEWAIIVLKQEQQQQQQQQSRGKMGATTKDA